MSQSATLGVLLDHAQDKVALVDESGTISYVNAAAERILGYSPDELIGTDAFERVHPDDLANVKRTFSQVTAREEFAENSIEYRFRAKDGSWVWLESRMSNLTDSALDGYVVSSRDVTDRIEAERSMQESTDRLSEIASVSSDVLWMFDADWSELLFVNPAYEDIYGGSIEEVRESPARFLETVHPDDVPAVKEAMDSLAAGNAVDMEYRVNPEKGYNVWVWVQAHAIVEDGEVVRIAGFSRDVTDHRRRQRQLMVMDNLLRHNVRNELNVMLGTAELIEEEIPEARDRTAVIQQTGERLLQSAEKQREIIELFNDRSPGLERLDLREIADQSAGRVRERYPGTSIEIDGAVSAHARAREELPMAVVELLENVVQHCVDAEPTVQISVRETESRVELVVEDRLSPIPEIEANVLRGDHEMDGIYHSSGLGFWLVYWTVELSGGEISVHSATGHGNRITLSLPRAEV